MHYTVNSLLMTAHQKAYEAGIIHRDISAGNILLVKDEDGDWVGMLNDWELSKKVETEVTEARQPDRTVSYAVGYFVQGRPLTRSTGHLAVHVRTRSQRRRTADWHRG